jgi:cysteinyl-tRNA synthetase
LKIIVRGREQHLLQAYRDAHQDLSASLKDDIMSAFAAYYQSKLAKSLKDADAQQENESESHAFERLAQKDQCDAAWAKEMREKDEKFGLILGSLVGSNLKSDMIIRHRES